MEQPQQLVDRSSACILTLPDRSSGRDAVGQGGWEQT
jgi:hypothetical protein